jgi:hypothetical protein
MVDLAEVAGRTHDVASAMDEAKAVLVRAERVLGEQEVDHALTRRLSDVRSLADSAERVSRLEQDASRKRLAASMGENVAQSDEADRALWSAFSNSVSEAANIPWALRESREDLARLRDDLERSSKLLGAAAEHADALDRMPEYDGNADLLANVRGVKGVVDKAHEGVAEAVARVEAVRTITSRFEQDPPHLRSGELAEKVTSTSNKLRVELVAAQDKVREVRGPVVANKAAVEKATQQAIDQAVTAKDAERDAKDLAKNVQAATNPTLAAAQHVRTSSQDELRRRLDGPAQQTGVQR